MIKSILHIGFVGACCFVFHATAAAGEPPFQVRMENFTVTPSTGPVVNVEIRNRSEQNMEAAVKVRWPDGWKGAPEEQKVTLPPGETAKAAFTIEKAIDVAANRYPVTIEASAGDHFVTRSQQVVCATAPYLKPQLDGRLDDWRDAAPITFTTGGRATTVMTCWNRKQFWLAVRAEQMNAGAVQFSLAPGAAEHPERFEFVVVAPEKDGPAKCCQLMQPGDDPAIAEQLRPLAGLESDAVEARATRDGTTMCFEITAPVNAIPGLRPTPGRTFRFSLLVHTPDGLRDLGAVMNLWEDRPAPRSWSRWEGAAFGATPPSDGGAEFGFSSSIH